MLDLASAVFGDLQTSIVAVFGSNLGWFIGHALLLGSALFIWRAWSNRDHIRAKSGWNASTLFDIASILVLTLVQFFIYTGSLGYPNTASLGLAVTGALMIRWFIDVVN